MITPSDTATSNRTENPTFSSGPSGFGTGTGGVSANPTFTDTSPGPFANSTGTSGGQVGPTETGPSGTGVDPERTSTTIVTNRTTISVITYSDKPWSSWSATAPQPEETSTTTCTDETEASDRPTKANIPDTSFKSTATLSFADTTYTVPVPASYTSDIPPPDSNESEASSFADAVSASTSPAPGTAATPRPSPIATTYSDSSHTSRPSYPENTPSSITFDPISWSTSACSTTTFFDVITSPKFSLVPTASASICYGIKCDAASSCHDWMSVYPFTDANGNPITTTSRRPTYANATSSGIYRGQGTGTVTGGGGFYPAQTGTGVAATSVFTGSPWPSSPNATRNSAAYTNTAEVTANITAVPSISSTSFDTSVEATATASNASATDANATVGIANVTSATSLDTPSASNPTASVTTTPEPEQSSATDLGPNVTRIQPVETNSAAVLHPWVAWTSTLETSTTTDDSAVADPTTAASGHDGDDDGSLIHVKYNNLALDSMHKRAAVKAGRKMRKRMQAEGEGDRQEKKYDALLHKKRVEWEEEGDVEVRSSGDSCCQGLSVYCWFVKSKIGGDC